MSRLGRGMALFVFSKASRDGATSYMAQDVPQPGRPRRHTGNLRSCPVRGFLSGKEGLGDSCFFSASWQQGDLCPPCPDKNSSTSVRREPNIGVRRSRTALGDRCISMPTMFSVPGGTPVGGDCQGISLGWLSGNSFSTERVPLGVRGAERPRFREGRAQPGHGRRLPQAAQRCSPGKLPIPTRPREPLQRGEKGRSAPAKGGVGEFPPHKSAGGPQARTAEGPPAGGPNCQN